ncbi:uncharacterized protein [Nicotiana tomentosiformis]|uniref:uncharacterized protein n=1 Tax=Nicotiana tomentosiformis TaxID=4098 RepID=UPI00388C7FF9
MVNVVTLRSVQVLKDPTPIQKEVAPEKESGNELKIKDDDKKTEKKKDVLSQMPAYAKFLKEILTKKRNIEETSVVKLTEHYSAILQNKLPQKCGDPGSFNIPCSLGTLNFDKSLCDSGSSKNLMPFSIYRKLEKEIGEIRRSQLQVFEWKVKGVKEKSAVSEKDKCGLYPKNAEKKLSTWMCALVRARGMELDFDSYPD